MSQDAVFCIGVCAGAFLGALTTLFVRIGRSDAAAIVEPGDGVELYVGNLSYDMKERDLEKAFEKFGKVLSTRVIFNKATGRSKGFGFVEMADQSSADRAVKAMHSSQHAGRKLVVNEAKSRSRRD